MKGTATIPVIGATVIALVMSPAASLSEAIDLGSRDDTTIEGPGGGEICPGATLLQNDDGTLENGYAWRSGGVAEPDYG